MTSALPNLPERHRKPEADFGVVFRRWWEKNPRWGEYELKDTRGKDSLPFSALSDDQIAVATLAMGRKGVLVRRAQGTVGGADYSGLVGVPYWIVIKYPRSFEVIAVSQFLYEKSKSTRKSLSSARARDISVISVPFASSSRV